MTADRSRLAILFPADANLKLDTRLEQSRFAETAQALHAAGVDVIGAPFANELLNESREKLLSVDGILVWFNPNEGSHDRTVLNNLLREVASRNIFVSAHPDVIDSIGTKDILYRTRMMAWGCDVHRYATSEELRKGLLRTLRTGAPRVLKQLRGQSGDGVWLLQRSENSAPLSKTTEMPITVREAKRGSREERMTLKDFVARSSTYFHASGGIIDQEYQTRLPEGMVRCYLVRDRVVGFGEQLINMLHPAPKGLAVDHAPLPGKRLYFPPTRPDFQALKERLERQWVSELCAIVGLEKSQLPVLWDADFLYGAKDRNGVDTHVLCEINVSSVYPYPPSALEPLVAETMLRLKTK